MNHNTTIGEQIKSERKQLGPWTKERGKIHGGQLAVKTRAFQRCLKMMMAALGFFSTLYLLLVPILPFAAFSSLLFGFNLPKPCSVFFSPKVLPELSQRNPQLSFLFCSRIDPLFPTFPALRLLCFFLSVFRSLGLTLFLMQPPIPFLPFPLLLYGTYIP